MGHVARAPWDMLQGLHGTCCKGSTDMSKDSIGGAVRARSSICKLFYLDFFHLGEST